MTHTEDDHPGHSEREKRALDFIDYFIVPALLIFIRVTFIPRMLVDYWRHRGS